MERERGREKFTGKRQEQKGKEKIDVIQIQRQNSVENNPRGDGRENKFKKKD